MSMWVSGPVPVCVCVVVPVPLTGSVCMRVGVAYTVPTITSKFSKLVN